MVRNSLRVLIVIYILTIWYGLYLMMIGLPPNTILWYDWGTVQWVINIGPMIVAVAALCAIVIGIVTGFIVFSISLWSFIWSGKFESGL